MSLPIHQEIKEKLRCFIKNNKIPNILFYGNNGSGKKTLLFEFINDIYNKNQETTQQLQPKPQNYNMDDLLFVIHCSHMKGIKFIRDELKLFAKTNINSNYGCHFKSVVLLNADKLTIDAQSALRRCIEIFNHNTRFFIVVEDKNKMLKPIISRFCEMYIPTPVLDGKEINLHSYKLENFHLISSTHTKTQIQKSINYITLFKKIQSLLKEPSIGETKTQSTPTTRLLQYAEELYENGYSANELSNMFLDRKQMTKLNTKEELKLYEFLMTFDIIKREIRNEKILIFFILHFLFIDKNFNYELLNSFMD